MNDDQMDELVIQGAKDYNEPMAVPRDEMWARISAAREAVRKAPVVEIRRPAKTRIWMMVGAAAAVLVVGIAIGRRLEHGSSVRQPIVQTATTPESVKPTIPATSDSVIEQLRVETAKTHERAQAIVAATPAEGERDSGARSDLTYRLVVLQHLAGSEAMITAFRSEARHGEVDAQIANWSRELLSTTRMLEASSVSNDPTMKRLLEDLDLVIAQIARYVTRGTNNPDDLDLIEQSINKRGVINKLRSTLPARTTPVGL